jgi:hypothetical protein
VTEYEARARVVPLPEWFPKFPTLRLIGRTLGGRRIYGGKRKGYWTNGRVALVRWSVALWVAYTVWLALVSLFWCEVWLVGCAASAFIWLAGQAATAIKTWWLRDKILIPLHTALHEPQNIVGWPDDERPSRYLHFPWNWNRGRGTSEIKIELRPGAAKTPEQKDLFVSAVGGVLGTTIKPVNAKWRTEGKRPYVTIKPPWDPPKEAMFSDNIERLEKGRKPGEFYAGIADHNKLVKIVLKDTPQVGIAAQTNLGKSQLMATGGSQLMHDAAVGAVLDPKGGSLPCFVGIENCVYAGDYDEADELIHKLYAEFERRKGVRRESARTGKKLDMGPRIVIMIEEADGLVTGLRNLHAVRGKTGTPKAVTELLMLRNMGREYLMTQLFVTQSGAARAAGGGDGRDAFGTWFVKAPPGTWAKVTGSSEKRPAISPIHGRWHMFRYGNLTEVQVFGFPEPEDGNDSQKMAAARRYALSGIVTPVPENLQLDNAFREDSLDGVGTGGTSASYAPYRGVVPGVQDGPGVQEAVPGVQAPHLRLVPADRPRSLIVDILAGAYDESQPTEVGELMTLSEACAAGVITLKLTSAKTAAKRLGFPPEVRPRRELDDAKQYRRSDLEQWTRAREARLTVGATHG